MFVQPQKEVLRPSDQMPLPASRIVQQTRILFLRHTNKLTLRLKDNPDL
jgi:hypothetical protein